MTTISLTVRLPRDLHDRLLLLQTERQKEHPRRRVTVTEVAVEAVEEGLRVIAGRNPVACESVDGEVK